jgi:hypothetical protein
MAPDDAPTPDGTAAALDEVAARAGTGPDPGPGLQTGTHEALAAARHHLDVAWASSGAGTDVPDAARLRQVKRAVNLGLRPVTSHQVPFNRELAIAVDRLIRVVDELIRTRDRGDERAHDILARAVAGMATMEVGYADVEDEVARLTEAAEDLAARATALEEGLAAQRQAAGEARVREDVVLRAARAAVADGPRAAGVTDVTDAGPTVGSVDDLLAALAAAADDADGRLLRRLAAAGRPPSALLRAEAAAVAEPLAAAAAGAPVLDLASGRGEWLDAWAAAELAPSGVDDDAEVVSALAARGHAAAVAPPVTHLAAVEPGSLGAVTAAHLADVIPLVELVALVDAAALALRPGGALVLSVADPASMPSGSPLWADPRRHLVHRDLLVLVAFERGFAEAEVLAVDGGAGPEAQVLLARTPGG